MVEQPLILVSASGGLDSSTTLAILKLAGYENITACHFKYGHRGQDAEHVAISRVCHELDVDLHVFDIENLMRSIDKTSMLIDPNAPITTGTKEGLKQLDAWVNGRNMLFMTIMATYAESRVMQDNYEEVHFVGGFLNLSEAGHYPDNSEYFVDSCLNMFKYGTLIGNRIKPMYCLSNLMKTELFFLINKFKLQDIYKHTISCDRPIVKVEGITGEQIAYNCAHNGIPACGSGLLSYWGSKKAGLDDMNIRKFYEVDEPYEAYIPSHLTRPPKEEPNIHGIIDRILLPEHRLDCLHQELPS